MLVSGVLVSSVLGLHPGEDLWFLSGLVAASSPVLEAVGSCGQILVCSQHFYSRKVKGPPALEPTWAGVTGFSGFECPYFSPLAQESQLSADEWNFTGS